MLEEGAPTTANLSYFGHSKREVAVALEISKNRGLSTRPPGKPSVFWPFSENSNVC
jgi:hypothetical protein